MKNKLKIRLIELDILWEDPAKNLQQLDQLLYKNTADVVVLPEMFATGFSMNPDQIAEPPFGATYQWMKKQAEIGQCAIVGSVSTQENHHFYNRMYFVTPNAVFVYDKKHLFGYGKETKVYTAGKEIVTAEYLGWKFRLSICYDLRFPVWLRNSEDYDVLLCPANWPKVREEQWITLLKARAIENMAYCVGVNRTGVDGYGLIYDGQSKVFDPIGLDLTESQNHLSQIEISKEILMNYREKFGFLSDRDAFNFQ